VEIALVANRRGTNSAIVLAFHFRMAVALYAPSDGSCAFQKFTPSFLVIETNMVSHCSYFFGSGNSDASLVKSADVIIGAFAFWRGDN